MARKGKKPRPASAPAEDVEAQIAAIGAMNVYELRALWREQERSEPPAGLTKDLLARALTYRLQERAFGGIGASTARLLRCFEKPDAERLRRIKIGSVLVREHEGERHEVIAVPGGFLWEGRTYESLSVIANKITGTRWNGPRFFGLRDRGQAEEQPAGGSSILSPRGDSQAALLDKRPAGTPMKPAAPKRQRCAIYTRKSTEHNLDLAFNSLDAQREACEAYIKSQAHEGWSPGPDIVRRWRPIRRFPGPARPPKLLDLVRAKKIDVIVVYKVDRLTRSLADFAKLVDLFDAHEVSFVSVTQSFNTTSSMGRLTLNVLLSFAQFEREVIGERVRDKVAASKRKGLWVGGSIPLGYRSVNKKPEIVPEEADLVRKIFADYLRLGSVAALAASLEAEGIQPKPRRLADGRSVQAARFMIGPLAHLLKNRFYVGEVAYRGEVYPGEHGASSTALCSIRCRQSSERTVARRLKRSQSPHLLTGLIFDDAGHPMSPTHASKKGARYRYYVSHALLQGRNRDAAARLALRLPKSRPPSSMRFDRI